MARPSVYVSGKVPSRIEQALRAEFDVRDSIEGADGVLVRHVQMCAGIWNLDLFAARSSRLFQCHDRESVLGGSCNKERVGAVHEIGDDMLGVGLALCPYSECRDVRRDR